MRHVITFAIERSTKGAVRFMELDTDGHPVDQAQSIVGTLYVRKTALPDGENPPKRLTVVVESA